MLCNLSLLTTVNHNTIGPSAEANELEISLVMPCLNEAEALESCIENALAFLEIFGLRGEVIIVDNGSTDESVKIAESKGIGVVYESVRGYGSACLKGLVVSQGRFVIIADADGTYDFCDAGHFLEPLRHGFDVVIGSRVRGYIAPKAMPWLHRYIGVPTLTWLLNYISTCNVSDAHCGLRGIKREVVNKLNLQCTGMEFASEMILEAARHGLRIKDVPVAYYPRKGYSKLRTLRDGWRHLRFLLVYTLRR